MKELKEIPDFKTEDEEFKFWSSVENVFDYVDASSFRNVPAPMIPMTKEVFLHQVLAGMTDQVENLSRKKQLSIEEMVRQLVAAGLKQQGLQPGA
ncbi:MAG TPA: CopG family antitoxin [Candidatus Kapabacteria bacterium]|jgi:hypothetical protein